MAPKFNAGLTPEQRRLRDLELDRMCPRMTREERIARFSKPRGPISFAQMNHSKFRSRYQHGNKKPFEHMTAEQQREAWKLFNEHIERAKAEGTWPWSSQKRGSIIGNIGNRVLHPDRAARWVEIRQRVRKQWAWYKSRDLPLIMEGKLNGSEIPQAAVADEVEGL